MKPFVGELTGTGRRPACRPNRAPGPATTVLRFSSVRGAAGAEE